ncbi:MAG: MarR family winged helix-turn-helix transcriptional regulator [Eubacterium sp.]|nr:MarR family winged helix-turn-helix transcriptional regulator [Eubacterium sp.]
MDELKCYFKKIHNQLETNFTRVLRNYGLTCTQFDVLAYLYYHTESQNTLTGISSYFGVRHTSVIHVLKILEKKGMISKCASADARTKTISLTQHGQQVVTKINERCPALDSIVFAKLSETQLQLLEQMLAQILENLESDAFQNF